MPTLEEVIDHTIMTQDMDIQELSYQVSMLKAEVLDLEKSKSGLHSQIYDLKGAIKVQGIVCDDYAKSSDEWKAKYSSLLQDVAANYRVLDEKTVDVEVDDAD